jgi:hypothetical protein
VTNNITQSQVYLISSNNYSNHYEVLGSAILSHLLAIFYGGVISQTAQNVLNSRTIHSYGILYANIRNINGYRYAWMGKAFEYAVAELFNSKKEPYYSLILEGIEKSIDERINSNIRKTEINIDKINCVLVCKENENTGKLVEEFGNFRTLRDARCSLRGVAGRYKYFEHKVDAIFCQEDSSSRNFAVTSSLKVNRASLNNSPAINDFRSLPLDIAITLESPRFRGVKFYENLGVFVIHLPMNIEREIAAWNNAMTIVERALLEGERNGLLRFFEGFFKSGTPENHWIGFLANRIHFEIDDVISEVRSMVNEKERKIITPTMFGLREDASLDLTTSLSLG